MDVRNCKNCGKLFNYIGGQPLCPTCMKALDDKFDQVKEYIYDHPRAGVQEVAEENDVTTMQIHKWIRDERLSFTEDSMVSLECEMCGASIRTGRFCKSCKDKLSSHFGSLYEQIPEEKKREFKEESKMRFLQNRGGNKGKGPL
ncbi:flagellar protein [Anaerocolumna xylanovorans]|uniref:Flagellar operon protein TIGR03826 n=1 Tax=Anaerocolumna xylanovorans DSM 12503 TaxID=1121345 RepID=A0A1M7YA78_9FIRM|nr:flagellar protein [Anaerocolumna xylanovorans]SHO49476.1 flagellar operon protein TIGR03826 [Anaerocolumna xylanovorans DSM 12503]